MGSDAEFNTFALNSIVKKIYCFIFVVGWPFLSLMAQKDSSVTATETAGIVADSMQKSDTANRFLGLDTLQHQQLVKDSIAMDSISRKPVVDSSWAASKVAVNSPGFSWQVLDRSRYFDFASTPIKKEGASLKQFHGKENIFYLLIFLLLAFAILRQAFPKYFRDLFSVFFRTTLKQSQLREQLLHAQLPSLLTNIFFALSAGLYINFMITKYDVLSGENFWIIYAYACLGLLGIYLVKYIGLKLSGWMLGLKNVTELYIFIVFLVNKMIGIFILPLLVLLAFTAGEMYTISLTVSWCLLGAAYLYRNILAYSAVHNQIKVNPFHFFLYFCAFEIAPLLLLYKGLLVFFNLSA